MLAEGSFRDSHQDIGHRKCSLLHWRNLSNDILTQFPDVLFSYWNSFLKHQSSCLPKADAFISVGNKKENSYLFQ